MRVQISTWLGQCVPWLVEIKKKKDLLEQRTEDQLAFYDHFCDEQFKQCMLEFGARFNVNSFLAADYIKLLERKFRY